MFSSREVEEMVHRVGGRMAAASASNLLTCGDPNSVEAVAAQPELWRLLLDWEERMTAEPGALDGGTHLLFAARSVSPTA